MDTDAEPAVQWVVPDHEDDQMTREGSSCDLLLDWFSKENPDDLILLSLIHYQFSCARDTRCILSDLEAAHIDKWRSTCVFVALVDLGYDMDACLTCKIVVAIDMWWLHYLCKYKC
jgi:hypothetical protein